uniref:F5/8 type C domain-containing protein n=1 Tax=Trichobilharzia regenti TaxID=157069 RepID=A0AA85KJX5_TRIRE|nr:unnamed protein product [Trichobilharzia regenti]
MLDCVKRFSVSSTLNNNYKDFGKGHLFDKNPETCWNSDHGSPQWIHLELHEVHRLTTFRIQFQGGFSSTEVIIEGWDGDEKDKYTFLVYPEDNSSLQSFNVQLPRKCCNYRFVFNKSSDLYGRIIIYHLEPAFE